MFDIPCKAPAMNRLQSELHRLYLSPNDDAQPATGPRGDWIAPEGPVRAMVLELARPADWQALAALWKGVQADLALPAPAIAVSGIDGYQLWFSLTAPVPVAQAHVFLEALRERYLGDVTPQRVRLMPALADSNSEQVRPIGMVPELKAETGHWSAFVAHDLASIFADDPWLDRQPSLDGQADLLSRLQSIQPDAFALALTLLRPAVVPVKLRLIPSPADSAGGDAEPLRLGAADLDPKRFLLQVMNDAAVDLNLRIDAAKALLPYTP